MAVESSADILRTFLRRLEGANGWPPPGEAKLRTDLELHRALRESDRECLKRRVGWDRDRKYVLDPLAERIPGAFADLLYGEAPDFVAGTDADQERLDGLVAANELADGLLGGVTIASSEGEAWWRILADRALEYPTIEWHSRVSVVPMFSGAQLRAVAFVENLERPAFEDDEQATWRYLELQTRGLTWNRLYRSDEKHKGLGVAKPLTDHFVTEGLEEEWHHGLDVILAGRIRNRVGRGNSAIGGRSDYHGVSDLLLELNEAASIGSENMKLTAKKRVVVPSKYLTADGDFPAGVDVILAQETDGDPDQPDKGLVQLEWSFDAAPLVEWVEYLTDTALTRARVAPQLVGRATESAQTGPAFRARLLDSLLAAKGKGRAWDAGVPQLLTAAQMVAALEVERGGFGQEWSSAITAPTVERKSALPIDENEEATRVASEVGAEILSRETAIRERHPDWDDERVTRELEQIREYEPTGPPVAEPFAPQE